MRAPLASLDRPSEKAGPERESTKVTVQRARAPPGARVRVGAIARAQSARHRSRKIHDVKEPDCCNRARMRIR